MTLRNNARLAGVAYLLYIVVGIAAMVLSGRATRGTGIPARLETLSQHTTEMGLVVLLTLIASFCAVILGVTLYAITRDQDRDLALLAMACRLIEGVPDVSVRLGQVWLATSPTAKGLTPDAINALGAFLFSPGMGPGALLFAVASTIFSYLLLKGRMVPTPLAALGVFASGLLVLILPFQLSGLGLGAVDFRGIITWLIWLPALVFELWLAFWLIFKGVKPPAVGPASVA